MLQSGLKLPFSTMRIRRRRHLLTSAPDRVRRETPEGHEPGLRQTFPRERKTGEFLCAPFASIVDQTQTPVPEICAKAPGSEIHSFGLSNRKRVSRTAAWNRLNISAVT